MPDPAFHRLDIIHRFGAIYFLLQGVGALAWWVMLLMAPDTRRHYLAPGAPDDMLLAFLLPDLLLFVGASLLAACGLRRRASWTWPVLCAQAAASAYAELYCLNLLVLTRGTVWLGAALMAPSFIVPPWLAWRLRPRTPGRAG